MGSAALPKHARVVVVGGGVVGCSVLYHLAKRGWTDCVLLERRELSCGSSWHAAGAFHIINSNANLSDLQLHTLKFYPQLQAESEQDIGYHCTGGIYFASTEERLNYLKQERAKNRKKNPDMEFISLAEAKRLHPIIDESQFLGALYDPLDGYIDPASVVQAYAKAARKNGAQIFQHTMVTATTPQANGGWLVQTDGGDIHAEQVVNAGGLWAREVGRMAGIDLPLMPMEHHYLITEPMTAIAELPHELPNFVDFDGNAYGRQEGRGMLLGTYEEGGQAWSANGTPWDFGHELLPNQLERIAERLEVAYRHFPAFAQAGIKKVVNGPFTFAPDGNALIGPVPGLRNYWSACGVMAGYAQGAGVGQVFANWMVDGEPGMDVFAMDVARFGAFATQHYTHQKVVENFGRRFLISYPNEELPAARPWRTTALYDRLRASGAVMGAAFGLEHALWFARTPADAAAGETPTFRRSNAHAFVGEEVAAVQAGAGVVEIANFAKYEVRGAGARVYLDTLLACELPPPGRMRLAPMLSPRGRLLGDLSVANLSEPSAADGGDERYLLVGSVAAQQAHMRHFLRHLPASGVELNNLSSHLHGIAIAGPQSRALLERLTPADLSTPAFPFMAVAELQVGGVPVIAARVSFTGELGYELYCAPEYQIALYDALLAAGDAASVAVRPFGARALMSMRLEKNYGAWVLDYREDFTPQEAGLAVFVAADKPAAFIGKEAMQKAASATPARLRVTLAVDTTPLGSAPADAQGDEPIFAGGGDDVCGFVTSGGYGHRCAQSIAIAYVDSGAIAASKGLSVEILGERCAVHILTQPLYDPSGNLMRQ